MKTIINNSKFSQFQIELIEDAIHELSRPHYRIKESNDHYFYKKTEVDCVISQLPDPSLYTMTVILDEFGDTYCYKLSPVLQKERRVYKSKRFIKNL